MKTTIVGAGAMGGLFGGLLAEAGEDVWLYDVWVEHVEAMTRSGLRIEREGAVRSVAVRAVSDPSQIRPADLVMLFVKSTQTRAAALVARELAGPEGLFLTLQNGLGNADAIAEAVDPARVMAGTTAHGATLLGPGRIRHAGVGPTRVGMWAGRDPSQARRVAAMLTAAGIETEAVEDVRAVVWDKLLVNVGINAITALTGVRNGQLMDLEATRDLVRAAVEEAAAVARAAGVTVRENTVEHVFQVARATAANRSSMGQDVDRRRPTEIDAINGAVVKEGRRLGIGASVNHTLAALVETLQAHF
jgi:2-dehydropantoate 2-reductase